MKYSGHHPNQRKAHRILGRVFHWGIGLRVDRASIFVASSSESKEFADGIQLLLESDFDVTIWYQDVFGLSGYTLDDLMDRINRSDYAVIVSSGEDLLIKKGVQATTLRDNLLLEFGLVVGALGRQRTFLVVDRSTAASLPSDLAGLTVATFDATAVGQRGVESIIGSTATKIRTAIRRRPVHRSTPMEVGDLARTLADAVRSLNNGVAGVNTVRANPRRAASWQRQVIGSLHELYARRAADVSVALFTDDRRRRRPRTLSIRASEGIDDPASYYRFAWNEGMAGRSWATGASAEHSSERPHPWWTFRAGCENATYLCAPLIAGDDHLGLLAIGSDAGFPLVDADLPLLETFAGALAPTVNPSALGSRRSVRADGQLRPPRSSRTY